MDATSNSGSAGPSGPVELDALVFQYLERIDAGEDSDDVLEDLCKANPEVEDGIRRGVGLLRQARLHPGPSEDGLPDRIGQFTLERRLGVGGMGVVYLARQENPPRPVALKLIRPDQLWFEGFRERFTREIESAARLAHPGIAPVYEMGEHDGVPWFSQEYVDGAPLSAVLSSIPARAPETLTGGDLRTALADALHGETAPHAWDEVFFGGTWIESCVRLTRQVADALEHAHERGVLHRDVKPSNILLMPTGRAVLVDFGLARLQGTDRLTRTGAPLGSLHYMPPEQVEGRVDRVGPASDVYSLGVTLYELLTLRAPYASKSVQRLQGMIVAGAAPSPRSMNRAIPRDLDGVVRCAMDPDPARRYASAAAFAADLAAIIAHEPVSARPAGPALRMARWAKRRPAEAAAVAAGFGLLVITPTVVAVQGHRNAKRQAELNQDLLVALGERDTLLDATLDGFEGVVRWTAHETMQDLPGFQEKRLEVIDEGLAILDRVVAARPDDPDVRLQRALMMGTRANILGALGRTGEATALFERAATVFEETLEQMPDDEPGTGGGFRELARLRFNQGRHERRAGRLAHAVELRRAGLDAQRRALALAPDDARNHRDLARMTSALASDLKVAGSADPGTDALIAEAIDAARRAVELSPEDAGVHRALYEVLATRATWCQAEGRRGAAASDLDDAISSLERAIALDPADRSLRHQELQARTSRLHLHISSSNDASELLPEVERLRARSEALIGDYPGVPEYEAQRLLVLDQLAAASGRAGDRVGSRVIREQLFRARVADAQVHPDDVQASLNAAVTALNLTNALLFDESLGRPRLDRILDLCDQAEELAAPYERANGRVPAVLEVEMMLHYKRGAVFNQLEQPDDIFDQIDALRALDHDVPIKHTMTAKLLLHWSNRSEDESGRIEALDELERSVELGFEDLATWDRGEFEMELANYPRARELGDIVRSRAAAR